MIRMETDRLGGTTYTYSNLNDFLANRLQQVAVPRRPERAEPLQRRCDRRAAHRAAVRHRLRAGRVEGHVPAHPELRPALRLLHAADASATTWWSSSITATGTIRPPDSAPFKTAKNNFQPRVSFAWNAAVGANRAPRRVRAAGRPRPDRGPDPADRERPHLQHAVAGARSRSTSRRCARTSSTTRRTAAISRVPTSPDYVVPERVYQYSASVQQQLPLGIVATVAYVGSQGRNLFLRSIANRSSTCGPIPIPTSAAIVIREFDIVNADGSISRPFAEIDVKTSGGDDSYNAMQLSLARRFNNGLTLNSQYTLVAQLRHDRRIERGAHRRRTTRSTLADFDYDHRLQPVRRPPHVQPERALLAAVRPGRTAGCRTRRACSRRSSAGGTSGRF